MVCSVTERVENAEMLGQELLEDSFVGDTPKVETLLSTKVSESFINY
jgi:hypothetical protein